MIRREFIKMLGLLTAGIAAKPEQIHAFEQYYDRNSPQADVRLLAVDELTVSGMASKSTRVLITLFREDERPLVFGVNAFGGIIRWVAGPDQKIVTAEGSLRWDISSPDEGSEYPPLMDVIVAQLSYIDNEGIRRYKQLATKTGRL